MSAFLPSSSKSSCKIAMCASANGPAVERTICCDFDNSPKHLLLYSLRTCSVLYCIVLYYIVLYCSGCGSGSSSSGSSSGSSSSGSSSGSSSMGKRIKILVQ